MPNNDSLIRRFERAMAQEQAPTVHGRSVVDIFNTVDDLLTNTVTVDICNCLWRIHPDDQEKAEGTRRQIRVDGNPICPVHTRIGYMLFFLWVATWNVDTPK